MPASGRPPKKKDKSQSARFIEAARKAGVDESGAEFERAMGIILPPAKRPKKPKRNS